ncbi:MAG TPA: sortase [Candidatus Saccharimonadia bacterium]|nr:sortase [Candidatus Saccharimonadia bacterium]
MTLRRELITITCIFLSVVFAFKAGFLTIQHFLVVPSEFSVHALEEQQYADASITHPRAQLPSRLILPDERIDLPIFQSAILNGEWQLSTKGVSILSTTTHATRQEGYILYGHNWPVLLGNVSKAKIGEPLLLEYPDGSSEQYKIESVFRVSPKSVDVLDLAKSQTVLLYTCTGFLDTERLVVLAHFTQ